MVEGFSVESGVITDKQTSFNGAVSGDLSGVKTLVLDKDKDVLVFNKNKELVPQESIKSNNVISYYENDTVIKIFLSDAKKEFTASGVEDDCIIAISGSGETNTIVSAAKIAKNRGSKVLAVTSYPESTLGKLADTCLLVKGRTKKEVDDENYMKRQIHGNYTSLTPLGTALN